MLKVSHLNWNKQHLIVKDVYLNWGVGMIGLTIKLWIEIRMWSTKLKILGNKFCTWAKVTNILTLCPNNEVILIKYFWQNKLWLKKQEYL